MTEESTLKNLRLSQAGSDTLNKHITRHLKILENLKTKKDELRHNKENEDLKSSMRYSSKSKKNGFLTSEHFSETKSKIEQRFSTETPDLLTPILNDKSP